MDEYFLVVQALFEYPQLLSLPAQLKLSHDFVIRMGMIVRVIEIDV